MLALGMQKKQRDQPAVYLLRQRIEEFGQMDSLWDAGILIALQDELVLNILSLGQQSTEYITLSFVTIVTAKVSTSIVEESRRR